MQRSSATALRVALAVLLCSIPAGAPAARRAPALRILFVGNSLTYTNQMPEMVKRLAADGGQAVEVSMVAFPDFSLEDHLHDRRTLTALDRQWDVVILQQGPSALESSRRALLRDAQSLARLTRKKGNPRIALLMVWPARSRSMDFERVVESYRLAGDAVGGTVIPAGATWQKVLREHAGIPLYSADGFHPSPAGSYLTALAVYRTVIGPFPEALQKHCASGREPPVDATQCRTLVAAVEKVLERS
jgi:hypothetical protein